MSQRILAVLTCLALVTAAAWWGSQVEGGRKAETAWQEVKSSL